MQSHTTRATSFGISEDMSPDTDNDDSDIRIYNLKGQLMKSHTDTNDVLRPLPSGVYIINGKKVIVK